MKDKLIEVLIEIADREKLIDLLLDLLADRERLVKVTEKLMQMTE